MKGAPAVDPNRALSPTEWLDLWRTVYFDLPLALATEAGQTAAGAAPPSAAAGGRTRSLDRRRSQAEAGDPGGGRDDFASEFLDRLEGCFA